MPATKALRAVTNCTTARGTTWTRDGFKSSFGTTKDLAQIIGQTFYDRRGTAVMQSARAGCTVAKIASITGQALKEVAAVLQKHYFSRDHALGESAVAKVGNYRAGPSALNES